MSFSGVTCLLDTKDAKMNMSYVIITQVAPSRIILTHEQITTMKSGKRHDEKLSAYTLNLGERLAIVRGG